MKSLAGKFIVVIDDDPGMLRALHRVLGGEGATVTTADWAVDAVEILTKREQTIDLVITDLRMPFVTGLTVVNAVREIFPKTPVIVLTAFGDPEARAACREMGAAAFLEKPLDSDALIQAVREALGLNAPTRGIASSDSDSASAEGVSLRASAASDTSTRRAAQREETQK